MSLIKGILTSLCIFVFFGCAQVPKEAVELSATVGRDIADIKKSHLQLLKIHYDGLINNINVFIDDVYLPYQIQKSLSDDIVLEQLLNSLQAARQSSEGGLAQKQAFLNIKYFHLVIHQEVEDYRNKRLAPVKRQYKDVLEHLNASYDQIHYANSIVTGHLASVVEVHDAQNEILKDSKFEDMRVKVGTELAGVSQDFVELIEQSKEKEADLDKIITEFEDLTTKLDKVKE